MRLPDRQRLRDVRPLSWVRAGIILAVVVVVIVLAAHLDGGRGVTDLRYATPPDTTAPRAAPTTVPPNFTGYRLPYAYGQTATQTQVPVGPGNATLNGTVLGPGGPVGGATVQVTRLVGDATGTRTVTTAADGTWSLPGILGGRFRVRAWMAPTLDMDEPQIFFLGSTQTMPVSLQLQTYNSQTITSGASPLATEDGGDITVQVQVSAQTVDAQGYVDYPPSANVALTLTTNGPADAASTTATTDADGTGTFVLTCDGSGTTTGTVATASGTTTDLPDLTCEEPYQSPPSTTSPSSSTTTSTTLPGGSTTTTPTTNPLLP